MEAPLASVIITGIGGVVIAALKFTGKGNGKPSMQRRAQDIPLDCPAHSGLVSTQEAQHDDIIEIKDDVKELRKGQGEIKTLIMQKL